MILLDPTISAKAVYALCTVQETYCGKGDRLLQCQGNI